MHRRGDFSDRRVVAGLPLARNQIGDFLTAELVILVINRVILVHSLTRGHGFGNLALAGKTWQAVLFTRPRVYHKSSARGIISFLHGGLCQCVAPTLWAVS